MTKHSSFLHFMAIFVSYCPYFWGSSAVWNDHKTRYMFEGLTKTRHFLRFMAVFHELLPIVLGFQGDLKWLEDPIQVWGLVKNSSFSCFMAVFMSYCPHFWGSRGIRMARKTLYMFESYDQKLVVFAFYGRFHELLPIVLGFRGDLEVRELWPKTCHFCVLWPFSWVIVHNIGVPGQFKMIVRPDTCLRA